MNIGVQAYSLEHISQQSYYQATVVAQVVPQMNSSGKLPQDHGEDMASDTLEW